MHFKVRGIAGRVQGTAFDMLRYDASYPKDESGANALGCYGYGEDRTRRVVTLVTDNREVHWLPNFDRWASFGYEVLEVEFRAAGRAPRRVWIQRAYEIEINLPVK